MKKILFTATVMNHIKSFHTPYLKWLSNKGYIVHIACKNAEKLDYVNQSFDIPISRSPYKIRNLKAFVDLKEIINKNDYNLIHCHTPMGGVLTRLAAAKSRKKGTKVIYTAHGFHFFKGAPLRNWILYYPVEKLLSNLTDVLITINKEDYNIANANFNSIKTKLINGVGVNLDEFFPIEDFKKNKLRENYSFDKNEFILIYVAELSNRKNQEMLIRVMKKLKYKIPNIRLLLVGKGNLKKKYKEHIKDNELGDFIDLLGYRQDIPNLMKISDISVSSSKQEGLPVNIMESMATGLPLIATNCRGNRDLIEHKKNGFIVELNDDNDFANKIQYLYNNNKKRQEFGLKSIDLVKKYSLDTIREEYINIYEELIDDRI